jgi:hypothetical protein
MTLARLTFTLFCGVVALVLGLVGALVLTLAGFPFLGAASLAVMFVVTGMAINSAIKNGHRTPPRSQARPWD